MVLSKLVRRTSYEEKKKKKKDLDQAWENYGPGPMWGPLSFLTRPSKLEDIILIVMLIF